MKNWYNSVQFCCIICIYYVLLHIFEVIYLPNVNMNVFMFIIIIIVIIIIITYSKIPYR